ncbi:MAG TPA: hypothetical protein PLB52_02150 [Candidatus Moranbacteria bacterium]|nr:hypothetical protein [Candidatus Moranbacteria bacterium]
MNIYCLIGLFVSVVSILLFGLFLAAREIVRLETEIEILQQEKIFSKIQRNFRKEKEDFILKKNNSNRLIFLKMKELLLTLFSKKWWTAKIIRKGEMS